MDYVTDKEGYPIIKFHGFAVTSLRLMLKYPWHSVDSSSWGISAGLGSVYIPFLKSKSPPNFLKGKAISISNKNPRVRKENLHFSTLSTRHQKLITDYLLDIDLTLGVSTFDEDGDEKVLVPGVKNSPLFRRKANVYFYKELQNALDKRGTVPFNKKNQSKGFSI